MRIPNSMQNLPQQIAIFLIVGAVINFLFLTGLFSRLESITLDKRIEYYRSNKQAPPNMAAIMIDEESLQDMAPAFGRFPWPRGVYADLIDYLVTGGAKAILFDVLFTENEKTTGGKLSTGDAMLADASAESGITYHSAQIIVDKKDEFGSGCLNRPLPDDFQQKFAIAAMGCRTGVHNNFFIPYDALYRSATGIGIVGIDPDPDGIYRHIRLLREYGGKLYPALGLAPLLPRATPRPRAVYSAGEISLGPLKIPIAADEDYLINPYGQVQQYSISGIFASIKMIAAGDIEKLLIDPNEFRGKTVFIGASAVGLEDIKATALSSKTPGVLMQIWTMANIQEHDFLRQADKHLTIALVSLFTLLCIIAVFYCTGFSLRIGLPILLAAGYGYFAFSSFANNFVYDLVPPLVAIIASSLASLALLSFTEDRERRAVRKIFSRYVSTEIMTELLDRPGDFSDGEIGRREEMTILFSDIRGFTSISEKLSAEQVVDLLNCHFSQMTEVIFEYRGTLDKFIGDAIMAFWGAPLRVENHEALAVNAALEMIQRLSLVNAELAARNYPALDIGIGINSGPVILGNIGSEKKMDYTVIGDNVNLASRLEGLSKQYGYPLIISEYTRAKLTAVPCLILDQVRVKGKHEAIKIYAPLPDTDIDQARQQCQIAEDAFHNYQSGNWAKASKLYGQLNNPHLREVFLERCRRFAGKPPVDWDGVISLTSK